MCYDLGLPLGPGHSGISFSKKKHSDFLSYSQLIVERVKLNRSKAMDRWKRN